MSYVNNQVLPSGTEVPGRKYAYQILRVLGQGSFGITYLASVKIEGALGQVDVLVALKEYFAFDEDIRFPDGRVSLRREGSLANLYAVAFQRESDTLSKMNHPGIVHVLECFEANGTFYYSMEYLSGGSLNDKVTGRPMSESEALSMIVKVGDALSYMHSRGMMHLDMKPLNIVMKGDGMPVLVDFGLARRIDEDGKGKDIFALGAMLYKMLTGYAAPTAPEIDRNGFPEDRLKENSVSSQAINAIRKAMDPHPMNRPQNVESFLSMLEEPSGPLVSRPSGKPWEEWDDFAILIEYPECLLGGMGPDQSVQVIDSWGPTCFDTERILFQRTRFEPFLSFLLERFMKVVDLTQKDVRFILPSFCTCPVHQCVRDACDKWGIKRIRFFYEDDATALEYLRRRRGSGTLAEKAFELGVISSNGEGGSALSHFVFDSNVLQHVDYLEDYDDTIEKSIDNAPYEPGREFVLIHSKPDFALEGCLHCGIDPIRDGTVALKESLRGHSLHLRWGLQGESYKVIVPINASLPCRRSIKIQMGQRIIISVFQHTNPSGYLGCLYLGEGMIIPGEVVDITLEVDTSMIVTLIVESNDYSVRKSLLRPAMGDTIPLAPFPHILVDDIVTGPFGKAPYMT